MKFEPRHIEENVNISDKNDVKEFINGVVGFLCWCILAYFFLIFTSDLLINFMPSSWEKIYNQKVFNKKNYCSKAYKESERLNSILKELHSSSSISNLDIQIKIHKTKEVNAYATADYTIVINEGLLEKLNSDDKIAFVIAHEMGHFAHRDYLARYGKDIIPKVIIAILFGNNKNIYTFLNSSVEIAGLQFSKEQEKQADIYATNLLAITSKDPRAAIEVMKTFDEMYNNSFWINFLSTHPHPKERIRYIRKWINDNY